MSDIEIANSIKPKSIFEIAQKFGIEQDHIAPYGYNKAKLPLDLIKSDIPQTSKLVLVTAVTPTPAGEGKTTISIGLNDGLRKIGKKSTVVLREPSLGPVFGVKGGAAGGGHAQVIPMEDINLHFTGDFSAIEKANNLLSAIIDNSIQNFDSLSIDPRKVFWKRVMDMNDRALRSVVTGLGGKTGGVARQEGFNITAASEIMAILCLSKSLDDFKQRCGNIYIGDNTSGDPVYARQLEAADAMAILVKQALMPNLVQTLEGNPAIIHGGPFANIAQGTNSVLATKMGLSYSDFVVTEAGFGSDLGAEKFLDIKCRTSGLRPNVVVIVATVRALKYHGGAKLKELSEPGIDYLLRGLENLDGHIENIRGFNLPVVVAINKFKYDTQEELDAVHDHCAGLGVRCSTVDSWANGGDGAKEIAAIVAEESDKNPSPEIHFPYDSDDSVQNKIIKICKRVYGGKGAIFSAEAQVQLKEMDKMGISHLPVCIAKTQKSFSDNEKLKGRPRGFDITIREFEYATGAGFIVPVAGNIMRMPGLPKVPAAAMMKIDSDGKIKGLS